MTGPQTRAFSVYLRMIGRGAIGALRAVGLRAYALALVILIGWLTYRSINYLIVSLVTPSPVPPQIKDLPTRLDREMLDEGRSAFAALAAAEHPRSPLAHYHRLDSWIAPDRFNDCARSGCHAPLPHAKRKEVRAFLNMHATSIHCGVCHMEDGGRPLRLVWYDREHGGPEPAPPPILAAYALLTEPDDGKQWNEDAQARLVELLRSAADRAENHASLRTLADHFAAVRPQSETFGRMLEEAKAALPRYFRGEYGAKLALAEAATGRPVLGHPNTEAAVRAYLRLGKDAGETERKQLLDAVHPRRRAEALTCSDCHGANKPLIDFAAAGYPPARIEALTSPVVFRMIEHINQGRPFNLPGVLSADAADVPAD